MVHNGDDENFFDSQSITSIRVVGAGKVIRVTHGD